MESTQEDIIIKKNIQLKQNEESIDDESQDDGLQTEEIAYQSMIFIIYTCFIDDRNLYVNRTIFSDLFQTYLNGFISFGKFFFLISILAMKHEKIT